MISVAGFVGRRDAAWYRRFFIAPDLRDPESIRDCPVSCFHNPHIAAGRVRDEVCRLKSRRASRASREPGPRRMSWFRRARINSSSPLHSAADSFPGGAPDRWGKALGARTERPARGQRPSEDPDQERYGNDLDPGCSAGPRRGMVNPGIARRSIETALIPVPTMGMRVRSAPIGASSKRVAGVRVGGPVPW